MNVYASASVENFVKAIYKFELKEGSDTRSGSIARELGITNAAATDMARKLALKNLVDYKKYKELKLTSSGKKLAANIIRRHRLWETFLHKVLGLSMHEIHQEAELLEHATSDFLLEKISEYLGHPTIDPHGDPIPNKKGVLEPKADHIMLSAAHAGKAYEICRLAGSDKEFYDFCHANQMNIGTGLQLKKQYPKNKMTEIEINKAKLLLSTDLARSVFVKHRKK
jgi:DtxR family Mn-dependent transcriptional regulator